MCIYARTENKTTTAKVMKVGYYVKKVINNNYYSHFKFKLTVHVPKISHIWYEL